MMDKLTVVAYGIGTNSTAMLTEFVKRDLHVDVILFADTGGERPETYEYLAMFSDWLVAHGQPEIITVRKAGNNETLEENCLRLNMLPSIAYGFKSCSHKYKIQPQDKFFNNYQPAKDIWERGGKVIKLIGYDADESHRAKIPCDEKYEYQYPLVEWGWGRDECVDAICKAGLPQPGKSSCFFCPSMKPHEIRKMAITHPDLIKRSLAMEQNAQDNLTSVKGLGRSYAWKDLLATSDMFEGEFFGEIEQVCGCYDG